MKKDTEKYEAPVILSKVTVCEPVETGCCLKSCGGSPHHIESETLVSKETETKFKNIIHKKG